MKRLFSKESLKYAKASVPSKAEARKLALKHVWPFMMVSAILVGLLLGPWVLIVNEFLYYALSFGTILLLPLHMWYSAYCDQLNPLLYSDIKAHYDELGEFLDKCNYLDHTQS